MAQNKIVSFIPNTITLLNALSGCLSITFAFTGNLTAAGFFILLAAVFDFFDGMAARLLKVSSAIGKELDSLADDISFGVAPSAIAFVLVSQALNPDGTALSQLPVRTMVLCLLPFIMAAFSALRLAKFNLDERQTDKFIGLPTPANAMVWASMPFILKYNADGLFANYVIVPQVLIPLALVMSFLLVCELPLFSLKFKTWGFRGNQIRYIFLAISLVLIILMQFAAIPAIILIYVLMSVFAFKADK